MKNEQTILLVEDNEQDELLTIRALRKNNIQNEIIVCRDGAEALEWLLGSATQAAKEAHYLPRVVLLDLKLPKIDGLEVLRRLRADPVTRRLPIVVLTTSKEDSDIISSYDLGANSYVRKPVDFVQFNEAVKSLGLFWLLVNEAPPQEK